MFGERKFVERALARVQEKWSRFFRPERAPTKELEQVR
jgi:hypothetical protein